MNMHGIPNTFEYKWTNYDERIGLYTGNVGVVASPGRQVRGRSCGRAQRARDRAQVCVSKGAHRLACVARWVCVRVQMCPRAGRCEKLQHMVVGAKVWARRRTCGRAWGVHERAHARCVQVCIRDRKSVV